jgi:hypothetical protein
MTPPRIHQDYFEGGADALAKRMQQVLLCFQNAYLGCMLRAFEFSAGTKVPSGPEWLHEIRYDGYRLRVERNGDRWPDDARLSDIEPRFICAACGHRGADVRPDFNWNRQTVKMMGYR